MRPFSQACERNKAPILEVLRTAFASRRKVLELGSGTGQHAVHFAAALPHLAWQPSDVAERLPGIALWCEEAASANLLPPLALDVNWAKWPDTGADAVFTANTLHIVSWPEAERLVGGAGSLLPAGGLLAIYGPFKYAGRPTSESNERFDAALRAQDPASGLRDFEAVDGIARDHRLVLQRDHAMPANNRLLIWEKAH
jgi:hypothetical protein